MSVSLSVVPPAAPPGSHLEWALRYVRLGWPVFPLAVRSKLPLISKEQGGRGCIDASLDEKLVREWWQRTPTANIGVATGLRFFVLDKDLKDGGEESIDFLKQQHGPLPDTIQQVTGSGGVHYLFQLPGTFVVRNSKSKLAPGLDIRGHHGYIMAAPSIHPDTKRAYFWDGAEEIEQQKIAPAPSWLIDWLRRDGQFTGERPRGGVLPPKLPKGERHNTLVKIAGSMRRKGLSAVEMFPMLQAVNLGRCDPPYDDAHVRQIAESMEKYAPDARYTLFPVAAPPEPPEPPASDASDEAALTPGDVEAAIDARIAENDLVGAIRLAPEIARLRPMMQAVIVAKLHLHFKRDFPERLRAAFDRAIKGERPEGEASDGGDVPPAAPPAGGGTGDGPDLRFQPLTDAGNGERIVAMFGSEVRYCTEMKEWLIWEEPTGRWMVDRAHLIRQKAKQVARRMYEQALGGSSALEKHARASESYAAISAALGSAATEKGIPVSAADLDQQPYLLNCLNGVVDLRSGKLLPHNREFLITKLCPVEYDPYAKCPRFLAFLHWAMGANPDAELTEHTVRLVGFLQRAFGYALTSDVSEKAVFILHGERGNNGKTTLLTLFRDLLGKDYSGQLVIDTVMSMKNQDATTRADLADLRGVRLVVTSEVEKEHKLNEGKIKYITAGMGSIKSCRKYENPIEFEATHKLFMDCNHRPAVRGVDDAIWRRLKLVPFDVTISDDEKDLQLPAKLRAEIPGVLAWAVRGCMAWMKDGLGDPPEVAAAGAEWREHDDPLKEFLEDCCEMDAEFYVKATDLSAGYELWAKQNRERYPLGREGFSERLASKKFKQSRSRRFEGKQARTWEGIKLRDEIMQQLQRRVTTHWQGGGAED